jgi:hypothetical protein
MWSTLPIKSASGAFELSERTDAASRAGRQDVNFLLAGEFVTTQRKAS